VVEGHAELEHVSGLGLEHRGGRRRRRCRTALFALSPTPSTSMASTAGWWR
jgi:hypothetical protein